MAKKDDSLEIKKLLKELDLTINAANSFSREQIKLNRELLKVMALLEAGFAKNQEDARQLVDSIKDELELNDDYAKKWAKERGATKDDLDDIIKKFRAIEDLNEEAIENAKDYVELLEQQHDLLLDEFDISSKLLSSHQQIAKAVKESKRAVTSLGGSLDVSNDILAQMVKKKVDFQEMFSGFDKSANLAETFIEKIKTDINSLVDSTSGSLIDFRLNFSPVTGDVDAEMQNILKSIGEERDVRLKGLDEYFNKNKKLQSQLSKQIAIQDLGLDLKLDIDTGDLYNAAGKIQKGSELYVQTIDLLESKLQESDYGLKIKSNFGEIIKLMQNGTKLFDEQGRSTNKLVSNLDLASQLLLQELEVQNKILQTYELSVKGERDRFKILASNLDQLSSMESIIHNIGSGFDYINSILPTGIGEFLGLNKVSLVLLESHKKGVKSFVESLSAGETKTIALGKYMAELKPSIIGALNPMTLLVAGGILLFGFLKNTVDKYKEINESLKTSLSQSKQAFDIQLKTLTLTKNQFATMEDISQVQAEMIGSSGKVFDVIRSGNEQLTISLIEMGKAFGYGSTQATQMHKVFKSIGADDDLSTNLQTNLGLMSEMAGLSPQIVSQDLIDSSEIVSTYFAGMPEEAAKTVLQVRRMGMSLKQAGDIAQKMLRLDEFMTDMYELQAMSGGGIDFSSAFDKGLMGDIKGMTKDIMENIGSTQRYNQMDFLTRTKIANTLGLSVDELGKSVRMHEQMAQFSGKERDNLEANIDRMGDISKMNKDEIRNRLQQLQSTDRLGVAWEKIKGVLISALIPVAEAFADAIDAISPILDVVIGLLKGVGLLIRGLAPIVKGMLVPFKMIGLVIEQISGGIEKFTSGLSLSKEKLDWIYKISYGIGALIGTWFTIKSAPKFFSFIISSITSFVKLIPGIGSLFSGLVSNIGSMFGIVGKQGEDAVKQANEPINSLVSTVETSVKNMAESVKTSMNSMVESIKGSLTSINQHINSNVGTSTLVTSKKIDEIKGKSKDVTKDITSSINTEFTKSTEIVEKNTDEIGKSIDKVKDKGKTGFISSATVKPIFSTIGAIGAATFAKFAIDGAKSMFSIGEVGQEQLNKVQEHAIPMFETISAIGGGLLTQHLSEGMERVFQKKIEKNIEKKLEDPIKSASKKFDGVEKSGKSTFERIGDYGKQMFGGIIDFGKKFLPGSLTPLESTFDSMAQKPKEIIQPIEKGITETIDKKEILTKQTTKIDKVDVKKPKMNYLVEGITYVSDAVKTLWKSLKGTLMEIVKFSTSVLKELGSGIGQTIKAILKGISEGLSSFKTTALKGAAALVLVSGAIWITSKAMQNFATISWDAVGKGIATLGALTLAAMILGSASPAILLGSAAIAILGASLIPAAYALEMFNDVDWSSLGKAGVAIIGLGVAAAVLGPMIPLMLLGSIAIAALGASLIPTAIALEKFNNLNWDSLKKAGIALTGIAVIASGFAALAPAILIGSAAMVSASISIYILSSSLESLGNNISTINPKPITELTTSLISLMGVSTIQLFGIAGGLGAINTALIFNKVTDIFGSSNIIDDLERLAAIAEPLTLLNSVIGSLNETLNNFSITLETLNFDKIKEFTLDQKVQQQIEPIVNNLKSEPQDTTKVKITPFPTPMPQVSTPKAEAVAQDVLIPEFPKFDSQQNKQSQNQSSTDIYNNFNPDRNLLNQLVSLQQQTNQLLEALYRKELKVELDGQKLNKVQKKWNNV